MKLWVGDLPVKRRYEVIKRLAWVLNVRGVALSSEAWSREWGGFVDACFLACDDIDKAALAPVSRAINLMLEAA